MSDELRAALGAAYESLIYIFECSDDIQASKTAKEAADAIDVVLSSRPAERDAEFSRNAMLGYGHAAFCAGWKAAIYSVQNPGKPGQSGYDWLRDNPPAHLDEPLWREPLTSLALPTSAQGSGEGVSCSR